jgi:hypothetical protein
MSISKIKLEEIEFNLKDKIIFKTKTFLCQLFIQYVRQLNKATTVLLTIKAKAMRT